jgi:hypothetical protein
MKIAVLAGTSRYENLCASRLPSMKISVLADTSRYDNLCAIRYFQILAYYDMVRLFVGTFISRYRLLHADS